MTTPNAELAYKVLDAATAHSAHFNMVDWAWNAGTGSPIRLEDLTGPRCGTTACLAGWTVAMAGYAVGGDGSVYDAEDEPIGRMAQFLAAEMLGITRDQQADLFYCGGDQVAELVAEIFGPRPEPTA